MDIQASLFTRHSGQMAGRMAAMDWSRSPLGPTGLWSQTLNTLIDLMLASQQPMFMAWGGSRTWLYNDAFIPILGNKHPDALGRPAMDVWGEARAVLEPLFEQVFAGQPVQMDARTHRVSGWLPAGMTSTGSGPSIDS